MILPTITLPKCQFACVWWRLVVWHVFFYTPDWPLVPRVLFRTNHAVPANWVTVCLWLLALQTLSGDNSYVTICCQRRPRKRGRCLLRQMSVDGAHSVRVSSRGSDDLPFIGGLSTPVNNARMAVRGPVGSPQGCPRQGIAGEVLKVEHRPPVR